MTELAEIVVTGVAAGALYGLVALATALVSRTTGVLHFGLPALALLGAYATHAVQRDPLRLRFAPAVALALVACAAVAVVVSYLAPRMGHAVPELTVLASLGVLLAAIQIAAWLGGPDPLRMGDPWGGQRQEVQGIDFADADAVRVAGAAAILLVLFVALRATRLGVMVRALWCDAEAAVAHGVSERRVVASVWATAGLVAGAAGILLAVGEQGAEPRLAEAALLGFVALAVAGVRSVGGAVVGGLGVGLAEHLARGYGDRLPDAISPEIHVVAPWALLAVVLLLRPRGLFAGRATTRL